MSLEELNKRIKKLEKENKELKKENKLLKEENKLLKEENEKIKNRISINTLEGIDYEDIKNDVLNQFIVEAEDFEDFMKEYIITKYSNDFLNYYNKNYAYYKIIDKINFENIYYNYKDDYNITSFLIELSYNDWDKAQNFALNFLKNNIDNIREIKEFLDEKYEKFINNINKNNINKNNIDNNNIDNNKIKKNQKRKILINNYE